MHIQEYSIERQHCKYKVTQITVIIWVHLYILFFPATEWKIKCIATVAYNIKSLLSSNKIHIQ